LKGIFPTNSNFFQRVGYIIWIYVVLIAGGIL
jgi:hypothetical protein